MLNSTEIFVIVVICCIPILFLAYIAFLYTLEYLQNNKSEKNLKGEARMNIREIRLKLLLTQTEFAKAIGMSLGSVQNWEEKGTTPSLKAQRKILKLIADMKKM